jgi:hypothetical protein
LFEINFLSVFNTVSRRNCIDGKAVLRAEDKKDRKKETSKRRVESLSHGERASHQLDEE